MKAQVTLFILMGLMVLGVFIVLAIISGNPSQDYLFDTDTIDGYITQCLYSTAQNGLVLIGKQGGCLSPDKYIITPSYRVSLYPNQTFPSNSEVQQDLAYYVNTHLDECIEDFTQFRTRGWTITAEIPSTEVSLNAQDVSFELHYKVTAKKDSISTHTDYAVKLPVALKQMLEDSSGIISSYIGFINLTMLDSLPYSSTVFAQKEAAVIDLESDTYHFMFSLWRAP